MRRFRQRRHVDGPHCRPPRSVLLAIGIATVAVSAASPVQARQSTAAANASAPAETSLYQRLGGYDFVARLVDTAFPRVAGHPDLARLFRGHSADSQRRQRQLIIEVLCSATGGPCTYIGRPLTTVHEGLGITDSDWTTFMGIIEGALEELRVPEAERAQLLDLFETDLRPTVVVGGG